MFQIYVIDSGDRKRFDETAEELSELLQEEKLAGVPLMVFANKQDLPQAISASEVSERLGLQCLRTRRWQTQAVCAVKGQGLYCMRDLIGYREQLPKYK